MDVLQVLSTSDMEVRRKAIGIVLAMTTSRNVEDVVLFLKKELQKTQEADFEKVKSRQLYERGKLTYCSFRLQSIVNC